MSETSQSDPLEQAILASISRQLEGLALTDEAVALIRQRSTSMAFEARSHYRSLQQRDEAVQFDIAATLRPLEDRVATRRAQLEERARRSGEPAVIDADEVRRSMGIICPTPPFCKVKDNG